MARRTKSKKRKYLGDRTYGGGNTKNRRGKGSRGGVGRAGYHKHKWLATIKAGLHKSRHTGFIHYNAAYTTSVSLRELQAAVDEGKYQKGADGKFAVVLGNEVKVLSQGALTAPLAVKAGGFSAKAKEKIEKAGGSASS
jgi:large subunit ribosomal protein L15